MAVTEPDVRLYADLSDGFYARLGDTVRARANRADRLGHARCVLSGVEGSAGPGAVVDLLAMMAILAEGVAFDDATVVAFNASHGEAYRQALAQCSNG